MGFERGNHVCCNSVGLSVDYKEGECVCVCVCVCVCFHAPVVCKLLHKLLPVAAGAQVRLVEATDVLDDFLPLHALPKGHILRDVRRNLGDVLRFAVQPLHKAVG